MKPYGRRPPLKRGNGGGAKGCKQTWKPSHDKHDGCDLDADKKYARRKARVDLVNMAEEG